MQYLYGRGGYSSYYDRYDFTCGRGNSIEGYRGLGLGAAKKDVRIGAVWSFVPYRLSGTVAGCQGELEFQVRAVECADPLDHLPAL